jgi:protein arginine N-methyltransferase 1
VYSISQYAEMIADGGRMDAYARALRQVIKPGSVVLDIGTGTGVAAMLACKYGARRVFALEPSDAIFVAQEIAAANGFGAKIDFIQALSTDVTLPEGADVIVSDLRGVLPLFQNHLVAIADARARHLAPGGVMIPQSDTLWVAAVGAPQMYASITSSWGERHGLDLAAARRLAVNAVCKVKGPVEILAGPVRAGSIDYRTVDTPRFSGSVDMTAIAAGTGHGLCAWFDSTLADGIGFSNAPDAAPLVYGQAFFPWNEAVSLEAGERVAATLAADPVGADYLWQWHTRVSGLRGSIRADMRQSELEGELLSPATLRRQSATHVPQLGEDGRIDALILRRMDEAVPLGEIARELATQFPARFARWQDALSRVGDLSVRYGR